MDGPEVLTPGEMGEADRLAARLIPSSMLMENAGRAVARAIARHVRPCRTVVLCGPGNNGGDGYVVARLLARRGWPVATASLAPPRSGGDAEAAAAAWAGPRLAFGTAAVARAELVVDALFGAGLDRALPPEAARVLAAARRVVAVDVPSGLDGGTGASLGEVRQAALTVTFVRCKPGHLLEPGRSLCGTLVVADIGMPAAALAGVARPAPILRNGPGLWRLRVAAADDHKYARGVVTVCAGATMGGAARLAAHAARRAGAGLVRIAAVEGGDVFRAAAEPGLIVDEGPLEPMLADGKRRVWVCGPGLTLDEAARCLPPLLDAAGGRRVVVDAGALGLAAGDPARLRGAAVLTPHAGEFARVFGEPGRDRLAAARQAAALTGAVVVLKGASTIVAAPDGRCAINDHATPALATAGTGDTLAGIVGAMLAQRQDGAAGGEMPAFEAAAAAVWLHGEAGITAGDGLIAEDLAERLPAALARARALAGAPLDGRGTVG